VRLFKRQSKVERLRAKGDLDSLAAILARERFVLDEDGVVLDLDAPAKLEATQAVASLDRAGSVDALASALSSPAEPVRLAALEALGGSDDGRVVDILASAVGTERDARDAHGRSGALKGLLARDDVSAVVLASALVERDDDLVIDVEQKAVLDELLAHADHEEAATVTAGLIRGLSSGDQRTGARCAELLVSIGERAVEPVIAALQRPEARGEAARILGRLRDSRAVTPLLECLDGDASGTRAAAAWALGEIGHPSAVEALTASAQDPVYEVRAAVSLALNKFGNVAVLVHLTSLLGGAGLNAEAIGDQRATALPPGPRAAPDTAGRVVALGRLVRESLGLG